MKNLNILFALLIVGLLPNDLLAETTYVAMAGQPPQLAVDDYEENDFDDGDDDSDDITNSLELSSTSESDDENAEIVMKKNCNLRSQSRVKSKVVKFLKKGSVLEKVSTSDSWIQVNFSDISGYMHKSCIK